MASVTEHRPRGLPGFTMFKVKSDVYLKCNHCCQAWYRGQYPGKDWPAIGKADRYNLTLHAQGHRKVRPVRPQATTAAE
jgi:hypothetical protein